MQWSLILLFLMDQCCFMDCQLYQFHYIKEEKNWTEAQQYCREKHTDLVTVTNMKDMKRLINISAGDQSGAWIGLYNQTNGTRTWYWSLPGVEFDESEIKWAKGEPSHDWNHNCGTVSDPPGLIADIVDYTCPTFVLCYNDGNSSSFRHWNKDFNNHQPISDQCAMTVFSDGGRWKNENCSERKPFICYDDKIILIKESKTWPEALTYCRGHHHDLVTITNMDEQKLVQQEAQFASTPFVWIGLRFNCSESIWFWVCDNWTWNGQNDCNMFGVMQARGEYQLFQRNGSEKFNFICTN
ncbi:C-type mannose receptor 2-like [Poecilia reticulata]|uniref:C-type mannose receptor 2-like n=1 Tax=Poecilia reticulata TaxID=8081 RepID=UPI0004A47BA3|nr:PREDICTED: C-type mannose receptor 2-like [Poecilia reticulata]